MRVYCNHARIFSVKMKDIAAQILELAEQHKWRICSVESVTGGQIASAFTSISGASRTFFAGSVLYDTRAKIRFLDLSDDFFAEVGVYSTECAVEMALRWRSACDADFCISTTGEAEATDLPQSRVFFAVASKDGSEHTDRGYSGKRTIIQAAATEDALHFLLKMMQQKLR